MSEPSGDYVRERACRCGPAPERCVGDDEVLTQHGMADGNGDLAFLSAPRINNEREVSLLRGQLSPEQAARRRWARPSRRGIDRSSVRFVMAGALREAGFAVVHTPSGRIADDPHISVVWPPGNPVEWQEIPWPEEVVKGFEQCFDGKISS